jgi:F-type H+-transporting ATPase subunit gamma
METLETLSRRIAATEDLQSLVRSMKTLSAVSVRHFEKAEASLRLFEKTIDLGLQVVLRDRPIREGRMRAHHGREALAIFGSDRGLCSSFNENVAQLAVLHLAHSQKPANTIYVLAIGAQAAQRMTTLDREPDEIMNLPGSVQGLAGSCEDILIRLDQLRVAENVTRVAAIYNQRGSEGEIRPRAHVLLPVAIDHLKELARRPWPSRRLPAHRVDAEKLFSWLIRQHLFVSLYRAGLASMTSENAARLAAMQNAERNISEQMDIMTAEFRRLRQDAITTELMDIVGGYDVVRNRRSHPRS